MSEKIVFFVDPIKPESLYNLDDTIGVGFGVAQVLKGKEVIWQEEHDTEDWPTLRQFEDLAKSEPDHDWRVYTMGPLSNGEWQRQGDEKWVLIDSGPGFA